MSLWCYSDIFEGGTKKLDLRVIEISSYRILGKSSTSKVSYTSCWTGVGRKVVLVYCPRVSATVGRVPMSSSG